MSSRRGKVEILVNPLGIRLKIVPGAPLADELIAHGVEFPCGGQGRCRGCRVKVIQGRLEETPLDLRQLSDEERAYGWRLACQAKPVSDLTIELRQWEGIILADESPFSFSPAVGRGVAIDVGTTTLVAQLVDLATGRVLGTQAALNPQAGSGADVMSRIRAALDHTERERLTALVRKRIARMVTDLLRESPLEVPLCRATLVGNTAMHHLFLGRDVTPLAGYPFEPKEPQGGELSGAELGWPKAAARTPVFFLPVLGGFVGSDILAVILATRIHEAEKTVGAADLGTNGEIVVGDRRRIRVASTAAGPAFEGARISQGMRAAPGAIDRVKLENGRPAAHVIGGGKPRGICGSGLVDAVACGLKTGAIQTSGRIAGEGLPVKGGVKLTQQDIRELQLAKGAIASGIRILLESAGLAGGGIARFYLAGAFGNNLSVENTIRIGLLPFEPETVSPVGNAALLGAKIALFIQGDYASAFAPVLGKIEHVSLEKHPDFQDYFAEAMVFPRSP